MERPTFSTGGPGPWTSLALWSCVAALLAGCNPGPDGSRCDPECTSTFRCDADQGRCRPKTLTEYELDPPGRGLSATEFGESAFLSAIHPRRQLVVAGRADRDRGLRVLAELESGAGERTAIDGSAEADVVSVAWRSADGVYRISERRDGNWQRGRRVEVEEEYAGSGDFDVAVDADGRTHLLFRDRDSNHLRHLAPAEEPSWTLQTVDDGTTVQSRTSCAPSGPDLGYDPDAEFVARGLSTELSVSYYDSNCGDLRIARRSNDSWSVRVVDRGTFSIRNGDRSVERAGDVGRFSSLAATPEGELALAYQDRRRAGVSYATESNGGFGTALIDPGLEGRRKHFRGAFADLAFDAGGTPYIVYLDGTTARLRLASPRSGETGWILRPIESEPPVGFYAQIVAGDGQLTLLAERLVRTEEGYRSRLFRSTVDLP